MTDMNPQLNDAELIEEARSAYRQLHLEAALERFRTLVARNPASYDAQLGLAQTLTRMRQHEEAYEVVQKCIALDPQRFEGYAALGVLHFLADRSEKAIDALKKAIELAPADPDAYLTLAQVYADTKHYEDAHTELEAGRGLIAQLTDERQRTEMLAFAWHVEAYLHLAQGQNAEAIACAQEVIALEEANPHAACLAYSNLGILEARTRHYDQAIEYLEHAYRMNPFFQRAGGALGRILIFRGHPVRAAEVLAQVLTTSLTDRGSTRYAYAMALGRSGQRSEALAQYRQALSEGLRGTDAWFARWQVLWLNTWGRYVIIGVVLAGILAWVLGAKPTPQVLTLFVLLALILILRQTVGRRRR
jgi:tetratricopeptide (TPR) repeat protein